MVRVKDELRTFGKAQITAQVATVADFVLSYVLAEWAGIYYVAASFLGALAGGAINCALNYRWVFETKGLGKRGVAARYLTVWCGSVGLNTLGTYVLTELSGQHFILAKAAVAIVVAVVWNYQLQRRWVYRKKDTASQYNQKEQISRNEL